jgi:hypothetical protein
MSYLCLHLTSHHLPPAHLHAVLRVAICCLLLPSGQVSGAYLLPHDHGLFTLQLLPLVVPRPVISQALTCFPTTTASSASAFGCPAAGQSGAYLLPHCFFRLPSLPWSVRRPTCFPASSVTPVADFCPAFACFFCTASSVAVTSPP